MNNGEYEQIKYDDTHKLNDKVITIDFSSMNELIALIKNKKQVFYDPLETSYIIDGTIISERFLNEIVQKTSHLINSISNLKLSESQLISIKHLKESKKE